MFNMDNLTTGLTTTAITTNTTSVLASIAPYLALIVGILFAMFIIAKLIDFLLQAHYEATPQGKLERLEREISYRKRASSDIAQAKKYDIPLDDYE
jgi:hypothetical protein